MKRNAVKEYVVYLTLSAIDEAVAEMFWESYVCEIK